MSLQAIHLTPREDWDTEGTGSCRDRVLSSPGQKGVEAGLSGALRPKLSAAAGLGDQGIGTRGGAWSSRSRHFRDKLSMQALVTSPVLFGLS